MRILGGALIIHLQSTSANELDPLRHPCSAECLEEIRLQRNEKTETEALRYVTKVYLQFIYHKNVQITC
jgi:hypothetical protein